MADPVKIIERARVRAARIALLEATLLGGWLCLLTAVLALSLDWSVGQAWGERIGIALSPTALSQARLGLLVLTGAGLALTAWRAYDVHKQAADVGRLAAQIDAELNAQQEVLTFAGVIASGAAQAGGAQTLLLPILRRRVGEYLASFDPTRRFRLNGLRLLKRGALLAALWIGVLIAALAFFSRFARPPYYDEALRLDTLAEKLDKAGPDAQALARRLRSTAALLTDSNLNDAQKLERIAALKHELKEKQVGENSPQQRRSNAAGARGQGGGQGTARESGAGSGEKKEGQGQGGKGGQGRGQGERQNTGSTKGQSLAEQAQKELSKAEKQLLANASGGQKPSPKSGETNPTGGKEQMGEGAKPNPSRAGNQPIPSSEERAKSLSQPGSRPTQSVSAEAKPEPGQAPTSGGAGHGDTRLGQTPAAKPYARFYAPGEHGPPLELRNARYVTVRIPAAAKGAEGGKIVAGAPPSKAATPYANLPLPLAPGAANPEEQQLVPPRYRDLLR